MAKAGGVLWQDAHGNRYSFQVDKLGVTYRPRPGVFIIARQVTSGWEPLFIGECASFEVQLNHNLTRLPQWDCILHAGPTHIFTLHVPDNPKLRQRIEASLRRAHPTPCNR